MSLIFVTDKEHKADLKICEVKEYKADLKYWITDKEHKAKKDDAKSKKMYDNALTSRTIIPADPDDESGVAGAD